MAAGDTYEYGPGTLTFGATGTEIDVSCQVNSLVITPSKEQGDSVTKLCGTTKTPAATYTYTMTGNIDHDLTDPDGLWALSQLSPGSEVAYVYVPNTTADVEASGSVLIDPMGFGGDEYGTVMASDIEWICTGQPDYTIAGVPLAGVVFDEDHDETDVA
jgi:hypothetical protein